MLIPFLPKLPSELRNEVIIVVLTYIPYALSGISRSFSAFLLPQLRSSDSSFHITSEEETWIGSLTILTMPFGCLTAGVMMHYLGRKLCLLGILLPYIAAWAITVFAEDVNMLYLQTVLNGMGSGMTFCTATYVAEICSAKHRGPLLSLEEPVFNLGIALCNIVVHFNGWRHSAKGFLGISVLAFFLLFCLPESPNWLVMKGYSEKASRVLTKVRRSETEVKEEITEMEIHYELNRQEASINSGPGVVGALSNVLNRLSESRKAFLIMIGLFTFQQMTGYNVLVSYTVIFFDEMKLPADSSICAIVYSSAMFLISFIPPITTIYLGRKWSLAVSGLGMGLSLTVAAVYEFLYYQLPLEEKPFYLVPLGSIYVYNIFCSFGLMMLPFIMAGEVFPVHASGIACGVFGCVGYIIAGLVLKIFPYYLSWFGIEITLCTLALFAYASVPYAYYILPETHGKSINQIQLEYFSGDKSKRRATETTFA